MSDLQIKQSSAKAPKTSPYTNIDMAQLKPIVELYINLFLHLKAGGKIKVYAGEEIKEEITLPLKINTPQEPIRFPEITKRANKELFGKVSKFIEDKDSPSIAQLCIDSIRLHRLLYEETSQGMEVKLETGDSQNFNIAIIPAEAAVESAVEAEPTSKAVKGIIEKGKGSRKNEGMSDRELAATLKACRKQILEQIRSEKPGLNTEEHESLADQRLLQLSRYVGRGNSRSGLGGLAPSGNGRE